MFQAAPVQCNGFGIVVEQVDRRGAEQVQVVGLQTDVAGHGPGELELEADLIGADGGPGFAQTGQAKEVKALREHEVFLQDPVAVEDIARVGQQRLLRGKPRKADVFGVQPVGGAIDVQGHAFQVMGDPQVQGLRRGVATAQVKIQLIAAQAAQRLPGQDAEVDAHHRSFAAVGITHALDRQRVQADLGAGAKFAADAVHRFGKQRCAFGQHLALADGVGQRFETHDGATGQWPQIVGPEHLQQRMRQLRQVIVNLHAELGGEKRKAFQQPFHIRIVGLVTQKLRQLRVVLGKLTAQLTQVTHLFGKAFFQAHGVLFISRGCSRRDRAWPRRSAPFRPCG